MTLANRFLRCAVIYGFLGMALGVHMGASGDHSLFPAHAHLNLLGWVSLALAGLFYRAYPAAADRLAVAQFWVSNLGIVLMIPSLALVLRGQEMWEPVLGIASVIVLLGMLLFVIAVFRATRD